MGTPDFAVPSLEILLRNTYSIPAVVTAPDKPRGRGRHLAPTPIKELALLHAIDVLQPEDLKDPAFVQRVAELDPDLIVVVAFRILPREVFTIPRLGSFNLHASLLPKYRGAAPIHWALIRGEKETGVTTFFLQERVDTGSIILQRRVPIADEDDAGTLHDRLARLGAELVLDTVRHIEGGDAPTTLQDDAQATPAPKIFKDHCLINWSQPANAIHNLVRGLSPYPAAFTNYEGKILKIYKTRVLPTVSSQPPGSVKVGAAELHVATGDRLIAILELQLEGGKRMGIEEFLRGHRMASGERLGQEG